MEKLSVEQQILFKKALQLLDNATSSKTFDRNELKRGVSALVAMLAEQPAVWQDIQTKADFYRAQEESGTPYAKAKQPCMEVLDAIRQRLLEPRRDRRVIVFTDRNNQEQAISLAIYHGKEVDIAREFVTEKEFVARKEFVAEVERHIEILINAHLKRKSAAQSTLTFVADLPRDIRRQLFAAGLIKKPSDIDRPYEPALIDTTMRPDSERNPAFLTVVDRLKESQLESHGCCEGVRAHIESLLSYTSCIEEAERKSLRAWKDEAERVCNQGTIRQSDGFRYLVDWHTWARHGYPEIVDGMFEEMANALRVIGGYPTAIHSAVKSPDVPLLTESQQEVYNLIRDEGPLTGKQIVSRLGISSQSAFTTHYVPALKRHGIENRRGLGYFHPDKYKPE